MAFGIFIHRSDSIYDDSPAERYQFPSQYLKRATSCLGDWIIYYEPKKVPSTRGYFAAAKVREICADPSAPGMYFALIEPNSYLDFPNAVPFNASGNIVESGLLTANGGISGRAQSAVRPLSPSDFNTIVGLGLAEQSASLPRVGTDTVTNGLEEDRATFEYEQDVDRVKTLVSRVIRDRAFRRVVLNAYGSRCAVTGLKLINGGGRAEVEAAHIKPVEAHGPDSVTNGLALSGTAHWMFDRGLISVNEDWQIVISRHVNDVDGVRAMINKTGRILIPNKYSDRPHPYFLNWHREHCFKS